MFFFFFNSRSIGSYSMILILLWTIHFLMSRRVSNQLQLAGCYNQLLFPCNCSSSVGSFIVANLTINIIMDSGPSYQMLSMWIDTYTPFPTYTLKNWKNITVKDIIPFINPCFPSPTYWQSGLSNYNWPSSSQSADKDKVTMRQFTFHPSSNIMILLLDWSQQLKKNAK